MPDRTQHVVQPPGGPSALTAVPVSSGGCDCAIKVDVFATTVPTDTLTTIPHTVAAFACGSITGRNTIGYAYFSFPATAGGVRDCFVMDGGTVVSSATLQGNAASAAHANDGVTLPFFMGIWSTAGVTVKATQTSGAPVAVTVTVYQWEQCNCNCAAPAC